ncbi:LysR family transcriptional regulator [Paraburkholderia tropica]|uniref:helix-turn-helix domain-containing protein n=1 Tax=Paraburkholderia tropica TaxID=92647 RepID=UPI0030181718
MTMAIDQTLLSYSTARQREYLEAIETHGSERKAAEAMGVARGTLSNAIAALKAKSAKMGYAPDCDMTHIVPDGFRVRGVSTYYDDEGKPRGQWVKSVEDRDRMEVIMREAFAAMAETLPRVHAAPGPVKVDESLCNLYTFTDSHVGALAWHREGGHDWDLKIAEQTLVAAFAHMVQAAPSAKVGFINQLGDFLHSDGSNGLMPVTPMHGHILDQDGRYAKVVATAIRVLRRIVDFALEKHEQVVVLLAEGNHDISSSIWLRAMFSALYENEPRVTVIQSELPYYVYQHGKTMLAFHHGHLRKNQDLPLLFAAQFPKVWGETTKRVCHVGHRHHTEEKEHSGMTVVQHPTLAARDAYAARGGWFAERSATVISYHTEYGQVARNTVCPEMFEEAA